MRENGIVPPGGWLCSCHGRRLLVVQSNSSLAKERPSVLVLIPILPVSLLWSFADGLRIRARPRDITLVRTATGKIRMQSQSQSFCGRIIRITVLLSLPKHVTYHLSAAEHLTSPTFRIREESIVYCMYVSIKFPLHMLMT